MVFGCYFTVPERIKKLLEFKGGKGTLQQLFSRKGIYLGVFGIQC